MKEQVIAGDAVDTALKLLYRGGLTRHGTLLLLAGLEVWKGAVQGSILLQPRSVQEARQHLAATCNRLLGKRWWGRVWLNPPYGVTSGLSNQATWSQYLIQQVEAGNVTEAVLLVNAVPGNRWFARLWDYTICFVDRRIVFTGDVGQPSEPTHSNALVYLGPHPHAFAGIFRRFGNVVGEQVGVVRSTRQGLATQFRLEVPGK